MSQALDVAWPIDLLLDLLEKARKTSRVARKLHHIHCPCPLTVVHAPLCAHPSRALFRAKEPSRNLRESMRLLTLITNRIDALI